MKIAFFDGPSGASGDMILGSLLDGGLPLDDLRSDLSSLALEPFRIEPEPRSRHGIGGTGVRVIPEARGKHRGFPEIAAAIEGSALPGAVKERAVAVFRLLGEAEAAVHRIALEKVHFHEVGAVDSIVDIVGAVAGLHRLGVERVYAAPPVTGRGTVRAAHGVLPVPAPATVEVLRGRECRPSEVEGELLTPTGAALLVGLTERFGPPPPFRVDRVGYGVGEAERREAPNVLRLTLGETVRAPGTDLVLLLETDVDDVPAEVIGHLFERAFEEGALDVTAAPVIMKKNRPGHRLTLIVRPEDRDRLARLLMDETGTLGIRIRETERIVADREVVERETRFGPIRFKRAVLPGGRVRLAPEYEDCAAVARRRSVPFLRVWEDALRDGEEKE
ncbi:MAG: nickel pincer cofactor biosynthesis protein LarC [Candidatus Eisenbacteria bacterium]